MSALLFLLLTFLATAALLGLTVLGSLLGFSAIANVLHRRTGGTGRDGAARRELGDRLRAAMAA